MAIMDLLDISMTTPAMDSLNMAMSIMGGGAVPEQPGLDLAVMKVKHIIYVTPVQHWLFSFFVGGYIAGHDPDDDIFWDGAFDYHQPAKEQHRPQLKKQVCSSSHKHKWPLCIQKLIKLLEPFSLNLDTSFS